MTLEKWGVWPIDMGPALLKGIFSGGRQTAQGKIKPFQVGLSTPKKPNQPTKAYNSEPEGHRMGEGGAQRLELRSEGSLVLAGVSPEFPVENPRSGSDA